MVVCKVKDAIKGPAELGTKTDWFSGASVEGLECNQPFTVLYYPVPIDPPVSKTKRRSMYTSFFPTLLLSLTALMQFWTAAPQALYTQPEQIHLSYADKPTEMVMTWVTQNQVKESVVEYGIEGLESSANGTVDMFYDGGPQQRLIFIHRTIITGLEPGQRYMYHVGSFLGWSDIYFFRAMRVDPKWSPTLAVFGDMGNKGAVSLGELQDGAQLGFIDAVLHVGDFAYDLHTDNARVGDAFMNQIQPIAAYVPYMTCVGNHEAAYNFSNYRLRFSMPSAGGDGQGLFYSFNIGKAHIIAFSTEVYYYVSYGWLQIVNQYKWLEKDLQEANANRAERPWIIVMGHKPMYCSTADGPDELCNNLKNNPIRFGIPDLKLFGLEDLFYKYGVDLQFYAHEHNYERLWPVYQEKICNGSQGPYINPTGPVHIVTGSAGNQEGQTPFNKVPYPWSAFRTDDFGYTRLKIVNSTYLEGWECH